VHANRYSARSGDHIINLKYLVEHFLHFHVLMLKIHNLCMGNSDVIMSTVVRASMLEAYFVAAL